MPERIKYFLLMWLFVISSVSISAQSKLHYTVNAGTCSYIFNNEVFSDNASTFIPYNINLLRNFTVGGGILYDLTDRKGLKGSLNYASADMGYLYRSSLYGSYIHPLYGPLDQEGYIYFRNVVLRTGANYRLFKWIKLNYGLSQNFMISDKFDNSEIAENVQWYNREGKSRAKKYSLAFDLGFEIKLYKNLSVEISRSQGLNNFIVLNTNFGNGKDDLFPQKLVYTLFTLNYQFK